jgi:hypothetical protein
MLLCFAGTERPPSCTSFVLRPLAVVLAVLGIALATQLTSHAAMALRITVHPASPRVGQPASVTVLTLAPFSSHCVDDPLADMRPWWDWHPEAPHFELKAFREDQILDIPLVRRGPESEYWDGLVTFPERGAWEVRMVRPEWSGGAADGERCAGARIAVEVDPPESLPATSTGLSGMDQITALTLSCLVGLALLLMARVLTRHRLSS